MHKKASSLLIIMKFVFIPTLPTKEAWDNKAFKDCYGIDDFYYRLKAKDFGDNLRGYIYFKEGFKSQYKDGTEPRQYDSRKWWELGYTSCSSRCCFAPPNEKLIKWSESDGQEALQRIMKEHEELVALNYANHMKNPRPMPKFKPKPAAPVAREWQEFKRIQGPGGFIEQFDLITDKTTIRCICLIHHGSFRIE